LLTLTTRRSLFCVQVQRPLSPPGGLDTVLAAEVTQADAVIYSIGIDTTFTYNPAEGVRLRSPQSGLLGHAPRRLRG
jgi:hypothetical protein